MLRPGLPLALMEAMATGLPVIGSNIRGNKELIDDNKGGYVFDINDANDLTTKIKKLLDNKEKFESFGKYNIEKIKKYNVENILVHSEYIYNTNLEDQNIPHNLSL